MAHGPRLVARSDASMCVRKDSCTAGVAAEVLLWWDHQRSRRLCWCSYHLRISDLHIAEWIGILLSAWLLCHVPDQSIKDAGPIRHVDVHTDRQNLAPDCGGCPTWSELSKEISSIYSRAARPLSVTWTDRQAGFMRPVHYLARDARQQRVVRINECCLHALLTRNDRLHLALLAMDRAADERNAAEGKTASQSVGELDELEQECMQM